MPVAVASFLLQLARIGAAPIRAGGAERQAERAPVVLESKFVADPASVHPKFLPDEPNERLRTLRHTPY
jgi:hypothetical protein